MDYPGEQCNHRVLIREEGRTVTVRAEDRTTEAETGVTWPQAKERRQPPERLETEEGFSLEPPE